jgi:hypothetical protein
MDYTKELISILYTGIKHRIKSKDNFISYVMMNMSDDIDFVFDEDSFIFLNRGESFLIASVSEKEILFYPGESDILMAENPMLIRDALLNFLLQFKNYCIIESSDEILRNDEFENPIKPSKSFDEIDSEDVWETESESMVRLAKEEDSDDSDDSDEESSEEESSWEWL